MFHFHNKPKAKYSTQDIIHYCYTPRLLMNVQAEKNTGVLTTRFGMRDYRSKNNTHTNMTANSLVVR